MAYAIVLSTLILDVKHKLIECFVQPNFTLIFAIEEFLMIIRTIEFELNSHEVRI